MNAGGGVLLGVLRDLMARAAAGGGGGGGGGGHQGSVYPHAECGDCE